MNKYLLPLLFLFPLPLHAQTKYPNAPPIPPPYYLYYNPNYGILAPRPIPVPRIYYRVPPSQTLLIILSYHKYVQSCIASDTMPLSFKQWLSQ